MSQKSENPGSQNKPPVTPLQLGILVVAVVVAFIAGTRSDYIMATLFNQQPVGELDTSSLQEVYELLKRNYDGKLNDDDLIAGAKKGLTEAVGDPYTVYFTAEESEEFLGDLEGTFEGIGAELGKRDGNLIVVSPIKGSPAEKAGLKAGDVIATVNDEESIAWEVEKAVSVIRGEAGTTVRLGVIRDGESREISVVRGNISVPSVDTEIRDGIGVMSISRFGRTETTTLARQAAQQFIDNDVDGIVLDLRGNGGGYLQAAVEIASLWMKDEVVVTERSGGKVVDTMRTRGDAPLQGMKTIVLVDGYSASASEILAGALRDNGAARILGTQTFGKGVVQNILDLPDGSSLKVTVASWHTPAGQNISEEGLKPDVEVKLSDKDIEQSRDRQLDRALELLK